MLIDDSSSSSEFISLLLQLLSSDEGEIAMASAYMLQAAGDVEESRKATLTHIAARKARHVDILGVILVSVYRHPINKLKHLHNDLLIEILEEHGVPSAPFKALITSTKVCSSKIEFSRSPHKFLRTSISAEDHQIAIYSRLLRLTQNPIFLHALKVARNRLIRYRKELVQMLENA